MKKNNIFAVLDLGTTKFVCLVAEKKENNQVEIIAYSERPAKGMGVGEIINVQEVAGVLGDIFDEIENKLKIKLKDVVVGIAGHSVNTKIISESILLNKGEIIKEEDLGKLKKQVLLSADDEGDERIVDVIPKDYVLVTISGEEVSLRNPVGMYGKKLYGNFHVVSMKKIVENHLDKVLKDNGLEIKKKILEPIASSESTLSQDEKELGVIMIDIGGGTSDVAVIKDHKLLFTAVNPVGGNDITEEIKRVFNVTIKTANGIKEKYGSCDPEKVDANQFVEIDNTDKKIQITELAKNIRVYITDNILKPIAGEFNKRDFKVKDFSKIVLTGGGARIKYLSNLTAYKLALRSRIGNVKNEYELDGGLKIEISKELLHSKYATVVGLLLISIRDNFTAAYTDNLFSEKTQELQDERSDDNVTDKKNKEKKKRGNFKDTVTGFLSTVFGDNPEVE